MRIAMLGVTVNEDSRATNVARVMTLFDAAADEDPAPDLIAIPPGPDAVWHSTMSQTDAMMETYRALVAARAREWGVSVVLAQQLAEGGMIRLNILDADGDVSAERIPGTPGETADTWSDGVLGRVSVCLQHESPVVIDPENPPVWVIGIGAFSANGAPGVMPRDHDWKTWAREHETPVCLVRAAREGSPTETMTAVFGGEGRKRNVFPAGVIAVAERAVVD